MRDILKKIVNAILSVPVDKRLHFEAGVIIAAFFVIGIGVPVGIFFAVFCGALREIVSREVSGTPIDPWDIGANAIGGAVVSAFELIHAILF